ncbi:MFS family permease [Saccharothrix coeruleofusca]|uniref:MDR family MFS transporter n=1 Tax=Saccharothrix coeruleofusca TaxID=33919 RepID=UPI0027DE3124|nr:MFS transporter [Saccharothrix coeruleofusca]MBP2335756.1 MFS family permease [Saccharothrix coeruleofusca]
MTTTAVGATGLVRLLVVTQFAFNVGFYAVLPHLATHLSDQLGLAGWLVGLVLGLRTFSQQGLFVVGGALTDRFGPRPAVLVGCALRIAGFTWLAFARDAWSVLAAVVLIGFAAALFSPAVETEIARQAVDRERRTGEPRTRLLGLFHAAGQAGALLGPVLGVLALGSGFPAACLAGAGVFALVLLGHWRLMPRTAATTGHPRLVTALGGIARHRAFLLLCLAYGSYLVLYNQMYLALPAEVGDPAALGWLFALSSGLVVLGQVPVSRWSARVLSAGAALRAGLVLVAAGCVATALLPGDGPLPAAVFVVLLTAGQMLAVPAARALVPDFAGDRGLGLHTGALSSLSGVLVLVASAPLGALVDLGGATPWLVLAAIPLLGALCVPPTRREPPG